MKSAGWWHKLFIAIAVRSMSVGVKERPWLKHDNVELSSVSEQTFNPASSIKEIDHGKFIVRKAKTIYETFPSHKQTFFFNVMTQGLAQSHRLHHGCISVITKGNWRTNCQGTLS